MTRRLARLEALLPPPPPEVALRLRQCAPLFDRWDQLGAAAFQLLSPDEQGRVSAAVKKLHEKQSGPYALWFNGLLFGWSLLPALAPPVMKDLLLTGLDPAVATGFACRGCGLEYPFRYWPRSAEAEGFLVWPEGQGPPPRLPEFFTACPHCGASNTDILTLDDVERHDYPWKQQDGYAGLDPRVREQRR
jgi:hypothetical protein